MPPRVDAPALECLAARSLYPFVLRWFSAVPAPARAQTRILDVPAGSGILSLPLGAAGFDVTPADLFPEYFEEARAGATGPVLDWFERETGARVAPDVASALLPDRSAPAPGSLTPVGADMEARLPFDDGSFDVVLCVEGIEHVMDRHRTLAEFRRVLRPGGRLLLTTPNLLSLRARLGHLLAGQRAMKSYIDEFTSVWGRSPDGARTYHGHAFLVNYFQVRYSLHHTGFRLRRVLRSNWSPTSVLMSGLIPFVWLATRASQRPARRKFDRLRREGGIPADEPAPYDQMLSHLCSPALLYNATLIVEAEAAPS